MAESWFYLFLLAFLTLPLWIAVQNLGNMVLLMDMIIITFYGKVPPNTYAFLALLNVFAFGLIIFYKPMSPTYAQ